MHFGYAAQVSCNGDGSGDRTVFCPCARLLPWILSKIVLNVLFPFGKQRRNHSIKTLDFRTGLIKAGSHDLYDAVTIKKELVGNRLDVILLRHGISPTLAVVGDLPAHFPLFHEVLDNVQVRFRILAIEADSYDVESFVSVFVVHFDDVRQVSDARSAPGCPEVQ